MPYCPIHRLEYRAGKTHCTEPGCNALLVDELPKEEVLEFIDVYECYDLATADMIVTMLRENNIPAAYRDDISTAFPTTMGAEGHKRILAEKSAREQACKLIKQALEDAVIAESGRFI